MKNERLIRAREMHGLSQAEAARRIGLSIDRLCALENGRVVVELTGERRVAGRRGWTPSAQRIARFFGMDPAQLWPEEAATYCLEIMKQEEREGKD